MADLETSHATLDHTGLTGTGGSVATDAIFDAKGDLAVGTGANTSAKLTVGANDTIPMADSGQATGIKWVASQTPSTQAFSDAAAEGTADTYARGDHKHGMPASPGGGGTYDPIADKFGTPDTAYEFQSSSLTGLTALSPTPDVEDADTTVPDCYYLNDNASGVAVCGRYAAVSAPFTAIGLVADHNIHADYNYAGMFCGVGTPGKMVFVAVRQAIREAIVLTMTGPTDGGPGAPGLFATKPQSPIHAPTYFAIKAVSNTDVTYYISTGGRIWHPLLKNHDNTMTIGSVGLGMMSLNANGVSVAWDYLRIWNSALTMPSGI